ncbi:Coiled-coil domain-containing protein 25 [Spathaspora sp. JA1]|nr:Coiled-coil domain-containing protein 25 [Spathaspora sp. JA1]
MVYYFKAKITKNDELSDFSIGDSGDSEESVIYMGRDKIENDPLIKHSHPKNIWFHVDNYSSAHLYLQLTKEQIINFKQFEQFVIEPQLLEQIAQLTKANSIKGNKLNNITVIYTPVENLISDGSMDIGTVTFKNRQLVKRIHVAKKENAIINKLNKTKTEVSTEQFIEQQQQLVRDLALERKTRDREQQELNKQYEAQKKSNSDPYGDLFTKENLEQNSNEFRNENWVEEEFW